MAQTMQKVRGEKLTKRYGGTCALRSVDFELAAGTITVVLGGNGAGKSTLLSLVSLQQRPTEGSLRFDDALADCGRSADRARIGLVSHSPMLYGALSAFDNLELFASLQGVPASQVQNVAERFAIGQWGKRSTHTYSKGQRRRVCLARAALHSPSLMVLDEPTEGLDAQGCQAFESWLLELRESGAVVLLATHHEELAARVANQTIHMRAGGFVSSSGGAR